MNKYILTYGYDDPNDTDEEKPIYWLKFWKTKDFKGPDSNLTPVKYKVGDDKKLCENISFTMTNNNKYFVIGFNDGHIISYHDNRSLISE